MARRPSSGRRIHNNLKPAKRKPFKGASNASFQNLILKGYSFGIVFLKPFFRGVRGGEDLDVLGVANLFAGVDVYKNGRWSLFSLRLPQ